MPNKNSLSGLLLIGSLGCSGALTGGCAINSAGTVTQHPDINEMAKVNVAPPAETVQFMDKNLDPVLQEKTPSLPVNYPSIEDSWIKSTKLRGIQHELLYRLNALGIEYIKTCAEPIEKKERELIMGSFVTARNNSQPRVNNCETEFRITRNDQSNISDQCRKILDSAEGYLYQKYYFEEAELLQQQTDCYNDLLSGQPGRP